jgi:hypothetical protein
MDLLSPSRQMPATDIEVKETINKYMASGDIVIFF